MILERVLVDVVGEETRTMPEAVLIDKVVYSSALGGYLNDSGNGVDR